MIPPSVLVTTVDIVTVLVVKNVMIDDDVDVLVTDVVV